MILKMYWKSWKKYISNKVEMERGMYFDIRDYLYGASTEDQLLQLIKELPHDVMVEKARMVISKFIENYRNAVSIYIDKKVERLQE